VLYARRLDPSSPAPTELHYLMFGGLDETFLAHRITRPPDFDQVLSVDVDALPSGWDGTAVEIRIEQPKHPTGLPLEEGEQAQAKRQDNSAGDTLAMVARMEFYLETGDLAS
jgi:hypothetical protein